MRLTSAQSVREFAEVVQQKPKVRRVIPLRVKIPKSTLLGESFQAGLSKVDGTVEASLSGDDGG